VIALIFAALVAMVPWPTDPAEALPDYWARAAVISVATADVSHGDAGLAALLLVTMRGESHFDRRIHAGERHPVWTSDQGRAIGLLQLHRPPRMPLEEWRALAGVDEGATRRSLERAASLLGFFRHRCAPGLITTAKVAVVVASYGAGHCTSAPPWALARAREWSNVVRELRGPAAGGGARCAPEPRAHSSEGGQGAADR